MTCTQQGLIMLAVGLVSATCLALMAMSNFLDSEEGFQTALRWTGRLAFLSLVTKTVWN